MAELRELWAHLTPGQAQVLLEVVVSGSWPEWVVFRLAGKPVPLLRDVKRQRLMRALEIVQAGMKRSRRDRHGPPPALPIEAR
jgi:hypothetical protein